MTSTSIEMGLIEEDPKLNHSFNSDIYSQHISNLSFSNISKSKFAEHYQFLCKKCNEVPVIKFIKKNKIKYKCKCKESPRILLIKDIFKYLLYSDEIDADTSKLKCNIHKEEKYIFYCEKCKKNKCNKCIENCIEHENRIKSLALDRNTINKSKYIVKKIEEESTAYFEDDIKSEELDENNVPSYKLIPKKLLNNNNININNNNINNNNDINNNDNNNINNNISDDDDSCYVVIKEKKELNNDIKEEELINIIDDNNNEEINDEEYFSLNLFSIIIDDYKDYPNYNHIETISNLEKYISFSFGDFNEINLKYEFNEENIQFNSLELFGEIFVNNNKENCFLLINEKIMELSRYINISDIYDNSNLILHFPIQLDVKLMELRNKKTNNISFMFYGINTLLPSSDFSKFDTINITKMSYLFYNCSLLKQLPDISKFNTENVTDMSYMFYNCSSIVILPDISTWNMGNISDISYMFCNCESLIIIPDISNWNLNGNKIKNINYLFKNCKSLSKIPKLSKWKINKELYTPEMFDGCRLFEVNKKEEVKFNEKFFNCFKNSLNKITSCLLNLFIIFGFVSLIIFIAFLIFLAYYPIYTSFNLVEAGYSTKNPLEYFELNNYTNITFIANYYNITNLTIIFEQYENEESFINNKINFTSINKNIEFESDHKKYKILSIIIAIFYTLNLITLAFIVFNKIFKFINNSKEVFCLFILLIFYIISIILSSIILIIINRLYNSLKEFYSLIEYLFNVNIAGFIWNEVSDLNNNFVSICLNLFFTIIIIVFIITLCKDSVQHISIGSNKFFDKLIGLD